MFNAEIDERKKDIPVQSNQLTNKPIIYVELFLFVRYAHGNEMENGRIKLRTTGQKELKTFQNYIE